jgi:hypothetical protein
MKQIDIEHHLDRSIVSYEGKDGNFRGASFWGYGSIGRANDYAEFVEDMLASIDLEQDRNYD